MLRMRIYIIRDPDSTAKGWSVAGIKVPLVNFPAVPYWQCYGFNGKRMEKGLYDEFWIIPVEHLVKARPSLYRYLRGLEVLAVPTAWCSIDPVGSYDMIFNDGRQWRD